MSNQTENGIIDDEISEDPHQKIQVQSIESNVICVSADNQPPSVIHHQEEVCHDHEQVVCSQQHHQGMGSSAVVVAPATSVNENAGSLTESLVNQQAVSGGVTIPVNVNVPVISESDLGANVTTASIITIPVVPYTVIGDTDGTGAISVSLADTDALTHHQLQQPSSQQIQQLQNELTQQQIQTELQQHHQNQINDQQIRNEIHHIQTELQHVNKQEQLSPSSLQKSQQQVSQSQQHVVSHSTGGKQQTNLNHLTWEEAVSAEVLPVRCKDTNAELYKSRFGSGNKGKCIKAGNDWFTPTEFEALCGRGNSKDWKRSIRFGGRTLQTLIDKGFLTPHASSCICSNCVDDSSATGPIRPFTPYHRKRKSQTGDSQKAKLEKLQSKESNTDDSDGNTPGTPISAVLNPLTQALLKLNASPPASTEEGWKFLEELVEKLISAAVVMKSLIQDMKTRTKHEIDTMKTQMQEQAELHNFQLGQQQQQQPQIIETPQTQIIRIFDSNRIQYAIEVLDPQTFNKQFQTSQPNANSKVSEVQMESDFKIICQDARGEIKEENDGTHPIT